MSIQFHQTQNIMCHVIRVFIYGKNVLLAVCVIFAGCIGKCAGTKLSYQIQNVPHANVILKSADNSTANLGGFFIVNSYVCATILSSQRI